MPSKSDRNHKKITAADIARESGYSLTAVSFAFNKPTRISTEVREKILEAADRLGYTPDPGARKFAMGRQLAIGFLLPQEADSTMSNPYILGILRGVVKVCETKAYTLSILPPIKSSINKAIQNAAVDGFITVGLTITDKIKQNFDRRGLPIVTIGGDITDDITNINIDDEAAGKLIVEKAIELGHREFVFVMLKEPIYGDEYYKSSVMQRRTSGYRKALEENGLLWSEDRVVKVDSTISGGYEAAKILFEQHDVMFSCIVSSADIISLGILRYANDTGIDIPEQYSLVSFDGIDEPFGQYNLTTIVQAPEPKGQLAAETIFELIDNQVTASGSISFPFTYRKGNTLGPCPLNILEKKVYHE